jgi:hypothetical protein
VTWPAACSVEPGCLAHFDAYPAGCVCPAFSTPGGYHLIALDGRCDAHIPHGLPVQHVIFCVGCGRAWFDPPGDTTCTCQAGNPLYEDWLVDPPGVPAEAWAS